MSEYIPKVERETIITFNEKDELADVYTMNGALIRKLDKLLADRPESVSLLRTFDDGAREYTVPKKWVKVNASRILSEEQRKAMAESMKAARIAKFGKNP